MPETKTDKLPTFMFLQNNQFIPSLDIRFTEEFTGTRWGSTYIAEAGFINHDTDDSDYGDSYDTTYSDEFENHISGRDISKSAAFIRSVYLNSQIQRLRDLHYNLIFAPGYEDENWHNLYKCCGGMFFQNKLTNQIIINPHSIIGMIQNEGITQFENEWNITFKTEIYKNAVIQAVNARNQMADISQHVDALKIYNYFNIETSEEVIQHAEENPDLSAIVIHKKLDRFRDIQINSNIKECPHCKTIFYSEELKCSNCKKVII